MAQELVKMTFLLPPDLKDMLEKEAKEQFVTRSAILRMMMKYYKENVIDKRK